MEDEGSDVMAKRIVELEVECDHLEDEKVKLETEVKRVKEKKKEKSAKLKEAINLKERKWKEENEKIKKNYMNLQVHIRKLEIDLKASVNKRVIENVVQYQQKLMQEKDDKIKSLLGKQKLGEEKRLELSQRVEAMEKMMVLEEKKQKQGLRGENAMDAANRLRGVQGMMNEVIKKIAFEKMVSDEKRKKEDMVLFRRIESLELEKKEMEAKAVEMRAEIHKLKTEKIALFGKLLKDKGEIEMEGKIMEMKADIIDAKAKNKKVRRELDNLK